MSRAPAPVTVVTGNEELLVDRAVRVLSSEAGSVEGSVVAPEEAAGRLELDAVMLGPGDIQAAAAPSLFGDAPVVVVTGLDRLKKDDDGSLAAARAEILDYLERPDPDAVVVLVHSGGPAGRDLVTAAKKAGAEVVDASGPAGKKSWELEAHRKQFVTSEFAALKVHPTSDAVELLVRAVGYDLRALAGACAQLAADVGEGGSSSVDVDVVSRYFGGRAEVDTFELGKLVRAGRIAPALALLRQLLTTQPTARVGPLLVGGLAWQLRQEAGSQRRSGWSDDGLKLAFQALAAADVAIKGGEVDAAHALERMVITVGRARG